MWWIKHLVRSWIYLLEKSQQVNYLYSCTHVQKISFRQMRWWVPFKRCRAKLLEESCNYLIINQSPWSFALNFTLVKTFKSNLSVDSVRKMHTSKLNKFWYWLLSFITSLCAGANCKFMQLVDIQISCGCTQAIKHSCSNHSNL